METKYLNNNYIFMSNDENGYLGEIHLIGTNNVKNIVDLIEEIMIIFNLSEEISYNVVKKWLVSQGFCNFGFLLDEDDVNRFLKIWISKDKAQRSFVQLNIAITKKFLNDLRNVINNCNE